MRSEHREKLHSVYSVVSISTSISRNEIDYVDKVIEWYKAKRKMNQKNSKIIIAIGEGGFNLKKESAERQAEQIEKLQRELSIYEDKVYQVGSYGAWISRENTPYKVYCKSIEETSRRYGSTIARAPSLWGFSNSKPKGLIAHMLKSAKCGENLNLYGEFNTARNYLHVDTLAKELTKRILGQYEKKIINVINARVYSIWELSQVVKKFTKRKVLLSFSNDGSQADRESHFGNRLHRGADEETCIIEENLGVKIREQWPII